MRDLWFNTQYNNNNKKSPPNKKTITNQVLVVHACNPSYLGGEIERIVIWCQSRQVVQEISSEPIAGHYCHPHVLCAPKLYWWLRLGVSGFQARWGKKVCETPSQWIKSGCSSVYLSSPKHGKLKIEALWSIPGQPGQKVRNYLQNNRSKKGWRHGLSGRMWPA
jgi:hypothetical protein